MRETGKPWLRNAAAEPNYPNPNLRGRFQNDPAAFTEGMGFRPHPQQDAIVRDIFVQSKVIVPELGGLLFLNRSGAYKFYRRRTFSGESRWVSGSHLWREVYSGEAMVEPQVTASGFEWVITARGTRTIYDGGGLYGVDNITELPRSPDLVYPTPDDYDAWTVVDEPLRRTVSTVLSGITYHAEEEVEEEDEVTRDDLVALAEQYFLTEPELPPGSGQRGNMAFATQISTGLCLSRIVSPAPPMQTSGTPRRFQITAEKVTRRQIKGFWETTSSRGSPTIVTGAKVVTGTFKLEESMPYALDKYGEVRPPDELGGHGWDQIGWSYIGTTGTAGQELRLRLPNTRDDSRNQDTTNHGTAIGQAAMLRYMVRGPDGPYTLKGFSESRIRPSSSWLRTPFELALDTPLAGGWWSGVQYLEIGLADDFKLERRFQNDFTSFITPAGYAAGYGVWDNEGQPLPRVLFATDPGLYGDGRAWEEFEDRERYPAGVTWPDGVAALGIVMAKVRRDSYIGFASYDGSPGRWKKRITHQEAHITPDPAIPPQESVYGTAHPLKLDQIQHFVAEPENGVQKITQTESFQVFDQDVTPADGQNIWYGEQFRLLNQHAVGGGMLPPVGSALVVDGPTQAHLNPGWFGSSDNRYAVIADDLIPGQNLFDAKSGETEIISVEKLIWEVEAGEDGYVTSPEIRIKVTEPGQVIDIRNVSIVMLPELLPPEEE